MVLLGATVLGPNVHIPSQDSLVTHSLNYVLLT